MFPQNSRMVKRAYDHCLYITGNHYENFPVASLIIPRRLRPYIASVYAFARTADDFSDEKEFEGHRLDRLKEWELQLKNMMSSTPSHPIFIALRETVKHFKLPINLFSDLLTAFKMDVMVPRYKTFEQVLNYCRYSANPVGRIILHIMGYPAPKLLQYSDYICTALQLANFWQDIALDIEKDRIYLPSEDIVRFEYSEEDLKRKKYNESFRRLINFQVQRTKELFLQGKPLCGIIPGRLGLELRCTWLAGMTILEKIEGVQGNVFEARPRLTKIDAVALLIKALKKKEFN